MLLALDKIRRDGETQPRVALDEDHVAQLAKTLRDGSSLPPITVHFDGEQYWLADGFHRVEAHLRCNKTTIDVRTMTGDQRDAFLYAVEHTNGKELTLDDRRRCALRMVQDEEWSQWSDRTIGRRCGLDHVTVGKIRRSLSGENHQMRSAAHPQENSPMTTPAEKAAEESAPATVIPIDRARPASKPEQPKKRKAVRNGKPYEVNVEKPAKPVKKGGRRNLSIKAKGVLGKDSPVLRDDKQVRKLGDLPKRMQMLVALRIRDGESSTVAEAVEAITNGAPVDKWGKAWEAAMDLPPDDRRKLCTLLLRETDLEEKRAGQTA